MPPPTTDKDGRLDVLSLKQQLAEALGDNGPSYWQALTDFVSGKLNRQEFDFYANLYLSRQNGMLLDENNEAITFFFLFKPGQYD